MSFLLLVPVVLGAVLYKGAEGRRSSNPLPAGSGGPFLVGTLAALAVGLAAIQVLLDYVRRHNYTIFAVYRVSLAVIDRAPDRDGRRCRRRSEYSRG